ncbi:hypothetical protein BVG19_g2848 [[Candida] boidinii]|nr:hypothetical protein BVG19_g2848 [[Candida] boidinii]OWB48576.1 hypothetical protein B5S27_g111 [[Candida] boidinii]
MNQQVELFSFNASNLGKELTKTPDMTDNVHLMAEGAIQQSDDLEETIREQAMRLSMLNEKHERELGLMKEEQKKYYEGLQASRDERKQLENQIGQIKKEIAMQRTNTNGRLNLSKNDIDTIVEAKLAQERKEIKDLIQQGILDELKRISLGQPDRIASLAITFEQIQNCLPRIITDETNPILSNCTLSIRANDARSMIVKPIMSTDSLESKYKAIVALQRQLIFKYVKYTEWANYLSPLVSPEMQETRNFPAIVTTNRWNQIIIKLFSTHNIKQERMNTIDMMLAERPPSGTNIKTWLTNFVTRIREATILHYLESVIMRVAKILTSLDILFDSERLYNSKDYDDLLDCIKAIAMQQRYLNAEEQTDYERNDINLGIENFYGVDESTENSRQLNYSNKKFIPPRNNQPHKTYNQWRKNPNQVVNQDQNSKHQVFPHNKKYWCKDCICDSCKVHIKRFEDWKKSNRTNKPIYQLVSRNAPAIFLEYIEYVESPQLFKVDSQQIQRLREELKMYEDLHLLSGESDEM